MHWRTSQRGRGTLDGCVSTPRSDNSTDSQLLPAGKVVVWNL